MSRLAARLGPLAAAPADAELLDRFVAARDEEAFAALVRRHGPAVLAVCRRLTRHTHDAEDAFQAVFLVLARRAGEVRPGNPLGGWLYGVAVRMAWKAAERPWRRREVSGAVPDVPARAAEPLDPATARAVVEEVGRLSAAYRAAVVLCELEGRSRAAAARELGIAEGTLSSRLAAARKQLAARLAARGFAPAALGALAGVAVPRGLASATSALGSGAPAPAAVAALAHGVGRAMIVQKLKLVPLVVAAVASAVLAAGLFAAPPTPAAPPVPAAVIAVQPPAATAVPRPLPKGPNKILIHKNGKFVLLDPDGKNEAVVFEPPPGSPPPDDARLSPDGTRVALLQPVGKTEDTPPGQSRRWRKLVVRPAGGKGPVVETEAEAECEAGMLAWSPDGAKLVVCTSADGSAKWPEVTSLLVDAGTGRATALKLPSNHMVTGWLPGDRLLTTSMAGTNAAPWLRLHVMNLDGTEHKALTDEKGTTGLGVPSPGGARVLCLDLPLPVWSGRSAPRTLVLLDAATEKRALVDGIPLNAELRGFCWSPDGTKIAYTWRQVHDGTQEELSRKETESHLVVADPDGRNPRTILTEKGAGQWVDTLGTPDWR